MGLRLPRRALRVLKERGIFAQASAGLHYQNLAKRYVVRRVEFGGAAGDVGDENDGPHALVVAPAQVRLDTLRKGRTCELLITRRPPGQAEAGRLETAVLFRGVHGRLEDLSGSNKAHASRLLSRQLI